MAVVIQRPENFPETVKEVRQQPALSQEELVHELGVSFATINHWENCRTAPSKPARKQFHNFCFGMIRQERWRLHGDAQ